MSTFGYGYWQRREPLVPREQMWAKEEAKSIEERRHRYRCRGSYVTLDEIAPWSVYQQGIAERQRLEKEAHRKRLAKLWAAYRQRKALRETRKKRIEEKKQRKAERDEKRRVAQQIKEEARALKLQQQEKEKEEREKQVEVPPQANEESETATAATGVEAVPNPEDVKEKNVVDVEAEEAKEEETREEEDGEDDEDDLSTSSEESELSSSEEEPSEPEDEGEEEEQKEVALPTARFAPDEELNRIVTMWRGDITHLEIDAIVNAANRSLLGGGGIDGAIHRAAGDDLYNECRQLNGCATGHCKISRGYALPAKYVLHTVGPIGEHPVALRSCYLNCLRVAVQNGVRSLAFCGISTGIFGYPLYEASHIALKTVRRWLEEGDNRTKFDSIIFCVFLDKERLCYERLLPLYFPAAGAPYEVLPMQPGEDQEVPPMVEEESSSSGEEEGSDDDDGEEEEEEFIPDAPPPPPAANDANGHAAASQLASGVEALTISEPAPHEEEEAQTVTAHEGDGVANFSTTTDRADTRGGPASAATPTEEQEEEVAASAADASPAE